MEVGTGKLYPESTGRL